MVVEDALVAPRCTSSQLMGVLCYRIIVPFGFFVSLLRLFTLADCSSPPAQDTVSGLHYPVPSQAQCLSTNGISAAVNNVTTTGVDLVVRPGRGAFTRGMTGVRPGVDVGLVARTGRRRGGVREGNRD